MNLKPLTLLLAISGFAGTLFGQNSYFGDHEITLGYGIMPSIEVFIGQDHTLDWGAQKTRVNSTVTGDYFGKFQYFINPRLAIGLFAGYEKETGLWLTQPEIIPSPGYPIYAGKFDRTSYTVALEIQYYYRIVNPPKADFFKVYLTAGVADSYVQETDSYTYLSDMKNYNNIPNVYFSPLGLKIGRRLSGYCELGIGYKGILNFGINCKIDAKQPTALVEADDTMK
jgi:hypothetical protein